MVKTKKFIFMKKLGFDVAFSKSEIHELLLKAIDIPRELREVALIVSSELPTEVTIRIELGVPSKKVKESVIILTLNQQRLKLGLVGLHGLTKDTRTTLKNKTR